MLTFVNSLNTIRSNVWAVVLVILGAVMVINGHDNIGGMLVTGAFAILRTSVDHSEPK